MHHHHFENDQLLGGRAELLGHGLVARGEPMAPRDPYPIPSTIPYQPITGNGVRLNYTTAAEPFSYGLRGVNQGANNTFVNVLLGSFFVLLAITMLYRWVHMGHAHLRHLLTLEKWGDQRYWMHNQSRFWPVVKRDMLYAPLGRQRHNKEIQLSKAIALGTLPSRFHTILLLLYLASNIAYCLVLNWNRKNSAAVVAELRGRSGTLAAFNLIPTVLFALRNNPLIPLLRVSYDTFNLLHRWCARIMVLEAVVHTVCWAVNCVQAGGMYQLNLTLSTSKSYQGGMVGTCAFVVIALVASGPVRHAFYETFLNGHRLLVLVGLIGVYLHLDCAKLPQVPYVRLCLAFWALEWTWRIARIWYSNLSRQKGLTKVTIEALPAEACRVTFELSRPWHWQPGCHVHAYLPAFALWSSHPFSVAWAESGPREPSYKLEVDGTSSGRPRATTTRDSSAPLNVQSRQSTVRSRGLTMVADSATKPENPSAALPPGSPMTSVSLVMRARTGMTRQIYNKASAAPGNTITTWGAIEGPYGGHDSMSSYGTVLLFAGGVGITHCVGYVHHLLRQYQGGICSTKKILLIWSLPNTEALEWVRTWMDTILRMEGRRDILRIQLFITKPRHRGEVISNTGSVQMFPGRCNPQTILEKEVPERIGAMGVTVCGPGAFADSVRAAVRKVVTLGAIDFVEEAFTY